jgi:hypothetical protein
MGHSHYMPKIGKDDCLSIYWNHLSVFTFDYFEKIKKGENVGMILEHWIAYSIYFPCYNGIMRLNYPFDCFLFYWIVIIQFKY